jgi:hypothetical protein
MSRPITKRQDTVRLRPGALWKISARPGEVAIDCRRGAVWITQEGDARDFVLRDGGRFINTRHGRVIVQAMTAALVRVTRRWLRPWPVWMVLPAMASALPLSRGYESSSPGLGVALAVVFGLLAYALCDELRSRPRD